MAYRNCSFCMDELDETRSLKLKELLSDYFDKRRDLNMSKKYEEDQDDEDETLNKCKVCVSNVHFFFYCHAFQKTEVT